VDSLNLKDYNVAEDFQDEPLSSFPVARVVVGIVIALTIIFCVASYSTSKHQADEQRQAQQSREAADDVQKMNQQLEIQNQKTDDEIKRLKK
jgi:hypothetical protein